jgi:hypothetical protein
MNARLLVVPPTLFAILACAGGPDAPAPSAAPAAQAPSDVAAPAPAEPAATPAPAPTPTGSRCENGLRRVDFWSGEYPGPVVQLDAAVSLPARTDPCLAAPDTTCALGPGLYHPWAGVGEYITLRAPERYRASTKVALEEDVQLDPGEEIELITYLAEGYCSYLHRGNQVEGQCPGLNDDGLTRVSGEPPPAIQLFTAGCGAWVDTDDALFTIAGVRQGEITGYGSVGRAP